MKKKLSWNIIDGIGHLVLDDAPSNSMDGHFFKELHELTAYSIASSGVRAILVYGSGRHFSSGADLDDLLSVIEEETIHENGRIIHYPTSLMENVSSFRFFDCCPVPVIAAVRGVCIGSALELALSCHIRICSPVSVLGFPESTFNLIPGCGGLQKAISICGKSRAMELVLQGNTFSAEDALNMGLIDAIVPSKEVIVKAEEMAHEISWNYSKSLKEIYIKNFFSEKQSVSMANNL